MFNHIHSGSDRLAEWRRLRHDSTLKTPEQIVERFGKVTTRSRYLDYYTPSSWPNVFELVQEGMLDQTALTLVLVATLDNFGFINTEEVRIDVISNHITGSEGAVFVHEGKCYNFIPGEIVTEEYLKENSTCYDTFIITKDKLFT